MDHFQTLSANRLLFDLASRLGSLEGFLYAEEKVDKSYLPNWIDNIDHEFKGLSPEVRSEIQCDYLLTLLKKVSGSTPEGLRRPGPQYGENRCTDFQDTAIKGAIENEAA